MLRTPNTPREKGYQASEDMARLDNTPTLRRKQRITPQSQGHPTVQKLGEGNITSSSQPTQDPAEVNSMPNATDKGNEKRKARRRVSGLRLKAAQQSPLEPGGRRFTLRLSQSADDVQYQGSFQSVNRLVSKELPKLYSSDRIFEWRGFELERTPMAQLEYDATPYRSRDHFITAIYEALASPDELCEDRYLIWSRVTRSIMAHQIDPARITGTIPKAARFTHFVPSNLLIVKLPIDCHSAAGYLDFITKPIVAWAYGMSLGRELKLCGNTRYIAKSGDSAVEGVDFDQPHPALEYMSVLNPGVLDGFGSFNEADMGFRPFRMRPYKFDTPSVVVESTYGSDMYPLRYKACWWLQLMVKQVKAVLCVNVNPAEQVIVIEVWRNELPDMYASEEGPTRAQKVTVAKKDEYKGVKEEANPEHYRVEGGPLVVAFEDFCLRETRGEREADFVLNNDTLAQEAADLWFGDGLLVNDWEIPADRDGS